MSEAEIYEAQGRAHASLKQAKAHVATINAVFNQHAGLLRELASLFEEFVRNPVTTDRSQVKLSAHLKAMLTQLPDTSTVEKRIDDLVSETARVKQLQEQVDKF